MKNPAMLSFLSFLLFFPSNLCGHYLAQNSSLNASKKTVLPKKNNSRTVYDIGVVLDLETPQGKMSASCIMMALADFYTTHNYFNTELNPHWRDSNQDMLDATYKGMLLMPSLIHSPMLRLWLSFLLKSVITNKRKKKIPILVNIGALRIEKPDQNFSSIL